ncbi:MAG TPA: tetratricopeptide repeat protein [Kiloniellaceae bacterium]|nr:tetratricopeptide repeat protein [Kiloniellaceae bacterium]
MTYSDCRGVPVTCDDPALIEALDRCHEDSLAFRGDPVAAVDDLLRARPDFIMGHCFKAGMLTQAMETRIYDDMVRSVAAAEALADKANDRERGHIAATRAWIDGDFFGAVQCWEEVLVRYPFDLLALQLVHLTDVLLGDVVGQRDSVARVFSMWDEATPGYAYLLGFYSFGLEENRDFAHAEELGRQAIAMQPWHPYAMHSVAHVMEMKGRQAGGIVFMNHHMPVWANSNFRNHLWWHLSLFHMDLCQYEKVLEIYDHNLRSAEVSGDKYEELDSAALLWRLKLLDVDVGARWHDLADKWEAAAADTLYAFNDVHAMASFVCDNRTDAAEKLLNANERYLNHANDANVAMSRTIGLPFCRALQDFAAGRYGACVDRLLPVRYRTHRLGGSYAQRDIIGWTLLEAALRARRFELALALANERAALKPTSPQNWRLVARAYKGLGDRTRCDRAESRAQSMMAA